jgi:hypothetical protein
MQPGLVWTFCVLAVGMVVGRTGAARRFLAGFSPSPRLVAIGAAVLLVNAALPVIYRHLHEFKVGTRPTCGAAFEMNEASWLGLLPILCALTSLLPHPRENGKLPVQRRWFPVTLCLFWMLGTAVHLYSLGYVYDFAVRRELAAPAVWVLAWVLQLRLTDWIATPTPVLRGVLSCGPLAATLPAFGIPGSQVFLLLTALNVIGFTGAVFFDAGNRVARYGLLISLAACVASVMQSWGAAVLAEVGSRTGWFALTSAAYLVLCASVSRNPKLGMAGALAAAALTGFWRSPNADAVLWAMQAGFVFTLLHSLRWRDYEHVGAATVRGVVAGVWVLHAFIWIRATGVLWPPLGLAAGVLAVCGLQGWIRQKRSPVAVPVAAALVALLSPANLAVVQLQATSVGVVAVAGSFVLFGLGTALALTKPRWNRTHGTHGLR